MISTIQSFFKFTSSTSRERPSLADLPTELLCSIFERISPRDRVESLNNLSLTCKNFQAIVPGVKKKIAKNILKSWTDHPEKIFCFLLKIAPHPFGFICALENKIPEAFEEWSRRPIPHPNLSRQNMTLSSIDRIKLEAIESLVFSRKRKRKVPPYRTQYAREQSEFFPFVVQPICQRLEAFSLFIQTNLQRLQVRPTNRLHVPLICGFENYIFSKINNNSFRLSRFEINVLIRMGHFDILTLLRRHPNYQEMFSPLQWATICGTPEEIRALDHSFINTPDVGFPPLFYAALRGDPSIIMTLLELGGNPHQFKITGYYEKELRDYKISTLIFPLSIALSQGHLEASNLLMMSPEQIFEVGVPINLERALNTPFFEIPFWYLALAQGLTSIFREGLENITWEITPESIYLFLCNAIDIKCSEDSLEALILKGYELDPRRENKYTSIWEAVAFDYALKINSTRCVGLIIQNGYNFNNHITIVNQSKPLWQEMITPNYAAPIERSPSQEMTSLLNSHSGHRRWAVACKVSFVALAVFISWRLGIQLQEYFQPPITQDRYFREVSYSPSPLLFISGFLASYLVVSLYFRYTDARPI